GPLPPAKTRCVSACDHNYDPDCCAHERRGDGCARADGTRAAAYSSTAFLEQGSGAWRMLADKSQYGMRITFLEIGRRRHSLPVSGSFNVIAARASQGRWTEVQRLKLQQIKLAVGVSDIKRQKRAVQLSCDVSREVESAYGAMRVEV